MAEPKRLADGRYECQNCLVRFTKKKQTYIDPIFCSDICRKQFHFAGGMSRVRLKQIVREVVKEIVQPEALIPK